MPKRNCRFEVRLSKDEFYSLSKKARKAGMSCGEFVRKAIEGKTIMEAPSVDVPILIREVRRVGYSLNEILKTAYSRQLLDVPPLRKALDDNRAVEKMIADAYGQKWQ